MTKDKLLDLLAPFDNDCEVFIDFADDESVFELEAVEDEDGVIYLVMGDEIENEEDGTPSEIHTAEET